MKQLLKQLTFLKNQYNVVGIKQSFEDEGILLEDLITMRRITELCDLKLSVKIGGCEALSDINICASYGVNSIVAPMIESEFALQKFIESVSDINDIHFYINIESKLGYENIDHMLSSLNSKLLTGIVIGRSDLTKSYGFDKSMVDSYEISTIVSDVLMKINQTGLKTLMGGNVSNHSFSFIKNLYESKLLNYIETRNVIIQLTNDNINNFHNMIKDVLLFECSWLQYKTQKYNKINNLYINRINAIKNRIT